MTSAVPQGSVLGPVLFSIVINDTDSGIKHTLSKFAEDMKLSGAVGTREGRDAIQGSLDKLEKWVFENLMKLKNSKCKVLYLGCGNPKHRHRLGDELIESSPVENKLGVLVNKKLDVTQPCTLLAQEANCIMDCIQSRMGNRIGRGFFPSALVW